ncbi:helix-turn-helix domain-containing protein [Sediminibacillus albus]|uniref:Helix-turn-helix domain-containing protein n=1 Tax=Sediminibacillus albus TaxID=407036 RepID=A0A1G8ZNJ0_9BACI|nr:helix-turn-helix domain-containing protein [Sediminibacillus albus]SDK16692.1 Helix-turn-helix domain-containing protein [Sediminibacillus albus]
MDNQTKNPVVANYLTMKLENSHNEYYHPSFLLESQLLAAIAKGDADKAIRIIESINRDQRPKLAASPVRSIKNSLICSCTLFTRAMIKGGVHPELAFTLSDAYIMEIERLDNQQALDNLEYVMLSHFIQTIKAEEKMPYGKIVNRAITYIQYHILQDLNLHTISAHCFVHPSYLSHLFKKEVGLSIVKYINRKRIEEAKYYLLHTTSSISEIALLFKFCNQSYFSAQFKLYEGMTPREFRDRHL